MPLPKAMKIHGTDRCKYCGHRFEDADGKADKVYSKERAKWLEEAAVMAFEAQGDDAWVDWMNEGKELTKKGE